MIQFGGGGAPAQIVANNGVVSLQAGPQFSQDGATQLQYGYNVVQDFDYNYGSLQLPPAVLRVYGRWLMLITSPHGWCPYTRRTGRRTRSTGSRMAPPLTVPPESSRCLSVSLPGSGSETYSRIDIKMGAIQS